MDARFRGHDHKGSGIGDDARVVMENQRWV
jgi:hypothetical protein